MRVKTAILSLMLTLCPWALCYGQLSFSSIYGHGGYYAVRGAYKLDLDNGLILTPLYQFFTFSDWVDENLSISRYGLAALYELTDDWAFVASGFVQPKEMGDRAMGYEAGLMWQPFYYWKGLKNPFVRVTAGQTFYRSYWEWVDTPSGPETMIADHYESQREINLTCEAGFDVSNWNLKAQYHKVLEYKERQWPDFTFNWAELPYLTAIIQGFIKTASALRVSYRTDFISPYGSLVQYRYDDRSTDSWAVQAGLDVRLWEATFLGGVEIFEPRRDENRQVFFTFSTEVTF